MEVIAGKVYRGKRMQTSNVVIVDDNDLCYELPARQDIRNHSPDGFNWGYGGSGPAQLALALCADAMKNDYGAQLLYQEFKGMVIARMHEEDWEMTHADVLQYVIKCMGNRNLTEADLVNVPCDYDLFLLERQE